MAFTPFRPGQQSTQIQVIELQQTLLGALSGLLRLANGAWLTARNVANTADVNIARVNASNQVEFGAPIAPPSPIWATSGYANETVTVAGQGVAYYLFKDNGANNGTSTTTFNLTGCLNVDGAVIIVVAYTRKDATGSAVNSILNIQVQGSAVDGFMASGIASVGVAHTFTAARINGAWVIIGGIRAT